MRIATTLGSEPIGRPVHPRVAADEAAVAESGGFKAAWSVHFSRGLDALVTLSAAAAATSRLELGVGVVPTYPRHPAALAQQAATVQALSGGRLTLGVGVSHRAVIEGMHGLAYEQPVAHIREYLAVLTALLSVGRCRFAGEHYRVDIELTIPGTTPVPVLVGALSTGMARAGGELADGVVTWLAGPRALEEVILPAVRGGAEEAGRAPPRVVTALPVAVWDDEDAARAAADGVFARYAALPNYQRLFAREHVASAGALALAGSEAQVERQIGRLAGLGVTELWAVPYPVGDDPDAAPRRTRAFLAGLDTSLLA